MLTGGALVKEIKKVNFKLKITFSTLLNILLYKFHFFFTIFVFLTSENDMIDATYLIIIYEVEKKDREKMENIR